MQFKNIKPYRPVDSLIIPPAGIDGKNISLTMLTENHKFLEAFTAMRIKVTQVRHVFVPITKKPRTLLTPQYKKLLIEHKLRPVKGFIGDYKNVIGKNFYLDLSNLINYSTKKFKLTRFNTGRGAMIISKIIEAVGSVPEDLFQRVLVYSVNLDAPIMKSLRRRKIYPIYNMLKEGTDIPFDKLLLFFYDHSGGRFVLLYDKDKPVNVARIRSMLSMLESSDPKDVENAETDVVSKLVVNNTDTLKYGSEKTQVAVKSIIKNMMDSVPEYRNVNIDELDTDEVVTSAIVYHVTGDPDKAVTVAKRMKGKTKEEKKKVADKMVKQYSETILTRPKVKSTSRNEIVRISRPAELVDNQVPTHIMEKRKKDFSELLVKDLTNVFKPLETENLPLKVKSVKINPIKSPAGELKKTLKDRYTIQLSGPEGEVHTVELDIPHLTENGTFVINGQPKVLVNQLITHPIFFYKPYHGRLETSYAKLTIYSQQTKSPYLMAYMSGYKLPIMMFLGYNYGFKETMELFKIKYEIGIEKKPDSIKLLDDRFITFTTSSIVGEEVISSFKRSVVSFPVNHFEIEEKGFWERVLIKEIGTRNCIYRIDQSWKFILTPVAREVLLSKGDPTTLPTVIKYICEEVVKGTVDDRNSMDKQRVRTSEVFTNQIQKQVLSAYNEYLSKKLGGDETARLSLSPTKVFSEVTNSPNCQLLETSNPMEELSMMTRITPVGIGGIPDKAAVPHKALNIHYTYYGNIDPLETPDSPMVGIQQHLTVGATISNARGTFAMKDPSLVKPSEILSVGPAMVPFVESDDGCRVMMGTGQSRQVIPTEGAEPPAVQTGYESLLTNLLSENFIKKSPVNGVIISIKPDMIIVKDKDTGKEVPIDTRSVVLKSGSGKNGLSKFKPTVAIGQTVKRDQILAEGANISEGCIANGVNLLCAFMAWKGYNFEDGIVISESAAKKYISVHVEEEKVYLEPDDDVLSIVNVGDTIDKGGILITHSKAAYDVEAYKHLRTEGGIVSNIEVYANVKDIPEKLQSVYEEFRGHFTKINGKYPLGSFKEKNERFDGIMIKFTMEQHLKMEKGDKMNNRHGNKGVVSIIEKDENMPITPWGEKVDIILNPLGVVNRMNTGQTAEAHVGLIAKELASRIKDLPKARFISLLRTVLELLDGTDNKEYSKNVISKLKSMSDKGFNDLKNQVVKKGYMSIIVPPFKGPSRTNILEALAILGLKPSYKLKLPEFNMTTDPVTIGFILIQKLEQLSAKKLASRGVGPYVSKTLAPTAGKKRGGGQKFGESDLYGLLAWDCPIIIDEMFGSLSSDHASKNEMISEIIQQGKTEFRQGKINPEKELLDNMIIACHLESE